MNDVPRRGKRPVPCAPKLGAAKRKRKLGDADRAMAAIAKALGHPARVLIMRHLLQQAACLCGELCEQLPLAQSTVSQHLKVLKSAGLVQGTISRPRICYCANSGRLRELAGLLQDLLSLEVPKSAARSTCEPAKSRPSKPRRRP